jgi:hypothetical protein
MDDKDTSKESGNNETIAPGQPVQDLAVDDKGVLQSTDDSTESPSQTAAAEPVNTITPPPQDDVMRHSEIISEPASEQVAAEPNQENSTDPQATATPEQQVITPTGSEAPVPANSAPKKSGKGIIIAIVVVLVLVLVAIAVLVYLKATTSTKSTGANTSQKVAEQITQPVEKITTTDVDGVTNDVDSTLSSLNDTQDFAADVISDKALGLQ